MIKSTGFFRNKTSSLIGLGQALVERFDGEVPGTLAELVTLPGFGRKTANVVLGHAFGVPGITVDTHVARLVHRFGLTDQTDPVKIEAELNAQLPRAQWTRVLRPDDLPRAAGLPREEAGLRRVLPRAAVSRVRDGTGVSRRPRPRWSSARSAPTCSRWSGST